MPVIAEKDSLHYLADYERLEKSRAGQSWFNPVRKAAIAHFADQGFPTPRHEDWRYTNVAPIARIPFRIAVPPALPVSLEEIRPFLSAGPNGPRLVFVNGHFDPHLSATTGIPDAVTLASVAALMEAEPDTLRPHLARYAGFETHPFVALNTACFQDGAFIHVPRGLACETVIEVLYYCTGGPEPVVTHPRTLIVAEEASQLTVVETYAGPNGEMGGQAKPYSAEPAPAGYFTNAVTEIVAGDAAVVDYYRVQRESDDAFHIATVRTQQGGHGTVSSHTLTLSGGLTRNDVHSVLGGEGGDLDLNGLYVGRGRRHIDNNLRVEHASPHCSSREYYKGILEDSSHGVFTGRIVVHKDAQKTDAKQTNMNLLLSDKAQVDTKPQLEIFADDVKCTHGATIGQIDESELFYLRSRGIPEKEARELLVYAFVSENAARVKVEPLRETLHRLLFAGARRESPLTQEALP